jgi:hypothetical protein
VPDRLVPGEGGDQHVHLRAPLMRAQVLGPYPKCQTLLENDWTQKVGAVGDMHQPEQR